MSDDDRSPFDALEPAPPRRLIALAALAGGVLMVAAVAVLWGALTIAYGADPFPWVAVVVVTAVPSLLLAIGIDMTLRAFRGGSPGYWSIAAVVYVLVILGMVTILRLTNDQYVEQTARMDAACSDADIALLTGPAFRPGPWETAPTGDREGACFITTTLSGSPVDYLAGVADGLAAAGWVVTKDQLPDQITATHAGVTVVGTRGPTDARGNSTVEFSIPAPDEGAASGA